MSVASRQRERERAARIENNGTREGRVKYYDKPEAEREADKVREHVAFSSRFNPLEVMPEITAPLIALALRRGRRATEVQNVPD